MVNFYYFDPTENKTKLVSLEYTHHSAATMAINSFLRNYQWFMDQVNERKYLWMKTSQRPDTFVWVKLPEGMDARKFVGIED